MALSNHSIPFSQDKRNFFTWFEGANPKQHEVEIRAKKQKFVDIANHRLFIEREFEHLLEILQKDGAKREEFWFYCYYCSLTLKNYYTSYDKKDKADFYTRYTKMLKAKCVGQELPVDKIPLKSFTQRLVNDLSELVITPMHADKISGWAAFVNIHRLHMVFCRLTIKGSLLLIQELQWLAQFEKYIGLHVDVDQIIANINAPTMVFNYLSVGLFAVRLFMNIGLIMKHMLFASAAEQQLIWQDRLSQEVFARHCTMLNDLVWSVVNGICNLGLFFNLSPTSAAWLTAGFLLFDVSLLIYRRSLSYHDFLLKKAQYMADKRTIPINNIDYYSKHMKMIESQIAQLEIEQRKSDASYVFNIAAASLLLGSFSASLLLATPLAAVFCYCACTIGVAMYLSAEYYGNYAGKVQAALQLDLDGKDNTEALEEQHKARNEFLSVMAKNVIMPYVFVTIFAVSWPYSVAAVLVYAGIQNDYFSNLSLSWGDEDTSGLSPTV